MRIYYQDGWTIKRTDSTQNEWAGWKEGETPMVRPTLNWVIKDIKRLSK